MYQLLWLILLRNSRRLYLSATIVTLVSVITPATDNQSASSTETEIKPGQSIEKNLQSNQAHTYQINLKANQAARLIVRQKGIDVIVRLRTSDRKLLTEVDGPGEDQGDEVLFWSARDDSMLTLEVAAPNNNARPGKYEIVFAELRPVIAADQLRVEAQNLMTEAGRLRSRRTDETYRQALEKYQSALKLWQDAMEPLQQAHCLKLIGRCQEGLQATESNRRAIDAYLGAAAIYEKIGERLQQCFAIDAAGLVYLKLDENRTGLPLMEQELNIGRALGNQLQEARALLHKGLALQNLGELTQSLNSYSQALLHFQALGDSLGQASTLNNIGNIYNELSQWRKALGYYEQALALHRALSRKGGQAIALHNIAYMYAQLGEWQKALDFYNQSLTLKRELPDRGSLALTLHNIGRVYQDLGEREKAREYYLEALNIRQEVGERGGQAATLNNLGALRADRQEWQQALEYYNQALILWRATESRGGEGKTISNLGKVYAMLGERQKSLELQKQGLALVREAKDRSRESIILSDIGSTYHHFGEEQQALSFYNQAVFIMHEIGDRDEEAATLHHLMSVWKNQAQPRLAVYYGKQAVNRYQELRANIRTLNTDTQRAFINSRESAYRELANLLIELGRLSEAQQVLNLLKEEEYFSYVRRDSNEASNLKGRATLTPAEARLEKEYAEIADKVTELGQELESLNQLTSPLPAQLQRRDELDRLLQLAMERFQAYLSRLEKELGGTSESGKRLAEIQSGIGFQDTLKELKAMTLYTVVGEEKYSVILTPPIGPPVAAEYPISREELYQKVFALKAALNNPRVDPRPLAAELYDILLGKIEKNLNSAKVRTLLFSLDGALRYLPMAALYDKRSGEYLIEKYRIVVYTPAGASDLKNAARANWKGLGFGVSKAIDNPEVGNFRALSGVTKELNSVFRTAPQAGGVIEGRIYLDEQFTEQHFLDALRPREYPLIHIASHFAFKPGDSLKSFLLLGDGHGLTLERVYKTPQLFSGIDLLALSACETGIGEKDAEGKEVEGFGTLAQRQGAKAVLATLWAVSDESTAKLMSEFYRLRETQGLNKAEAMRQAQLQMLRGSASNGKQINRGAKSNAEIGKGLPEYKADEKAPYAHPYYWAPFILIGNWR